MYLTRYLLTIVLLCLLLTHVCEAAKKKTKSKKIATAKHVEKKTATTPDPAPSTEKIEEITSEPPKNKGSSDENTTSIPEDQPTKDNTKAKKLKTKKKEKTEVEEKKKDKTVKKESNDEKQENKEPQHAEKEGKEENNQKEEKKEKKILKKPKKKEEKKAKKVEKTDEKEKPEKKTGEKTEEKKQSTEQNIEEKLEKKKEEKKEKQKDGKQEENERKKEPKEEKKEEKKDEKKEKKKEVNKEGKKEEKKEEIEGKKTKQKEEKKEKNKDEKKEKKEEKKGEKKEEAEEKKKDEKKERKEEKKGQKKAEAEEKKKGVKEEKKKKKEEKVKVEKQETAVNEEEDKKVEQRKAAVEEEVELNTDATAPRSPNVVTLNSENFDDVVMHPDNTVLVQFSAPWCKHCADFASIYAKLADNLKKAGKQVIVAQLDATQYSSTAERFGANRGFPNIRLFTREDKTGLLEFTGHRSEASLKIFLRNEGPWTKSYDHVVHLSPHKWDTVVLNPALNVLVYFYVPWAMKKGDSDVLSALGENYDEEGNGVIIGILDASQPNNRKLAERHHIRSQPHVLLFTKDNKNPTSPYPLQDLGWQFQEVAEWIDTFVGSTPSEEL